MYTMLKDSSPVAAKMSLVRSLFYLAVLYNIALMSTTFLLSGRHGGTLQEKDLVSLMQQLIKLQQCCAQHLQYTTEKWVTQNL